MGELCTGAFLGDRPAPNGLMIPGPFCCFCGIVFNYSDSDLSGSDRCCCCWRDVGVMEKIIIL